MKSGKLVATFPIGDGVDANRFDPATGYIFASNGESGTLTVAHEDSPDKYSVLDNVPTAKGARTMELDPKSHHVFVVTQDTKPGTPTAEQPRAVRTGAWNLSFDRAWPLISGGLTRRHQCGAHGRYGP